MDVKGILNNIIPLNLRAKDKVEKSIKADSTTDRDANGQSSAGSQEQKREPMSEEQLEKSMQHLRGLAVVKENNLSVELLELEGKRFVLLKEPNGKIIRRIPEAELWDLQSETGNKGQLLSKSA